MTFEPVVGFLQWRTAQQKAVFDLFDRRLKVYETVRNCVTHVTINPRRFDNKLEKEFLEAKDKAYFLFGNDVNDYLETLRKDILTVRYELPNRGQAMNRINNFQEDGKPLFDQYMRFPQTVPTIGNWVRGLLLLLKRMLKWPA
jgi:hypothetical protein